METGNNELLRSRISRMARSRTLPHAVIFSGEGPREELARYYAAALECTQAQPPCLSCPVCRKVMEGIHPDVSWILDTEHKILPADTVRALRKDAFIRPNEGQAKVYIFCDSAQLDARAQNILLKTVEEGPPYAAFVFCAENSAALLQTIRSRCVEYKLMPDEREIRERAGNGMDLCRLLLKKKRTEAAAYLIGMEKNKPDREELAEFLADCREALSRELIGSYTGRDSCQTEGNLNRQQLMKLTELLEQYRQQCGYNIAPGLLLGALAAQIDQVLT